MKLWEKGYRIDPRIERFTVGRDWLLDERLVKYDCLGSIAHAKMLSKVGLLSPKEAAQLVKVLQEIIRRDAKGSFRIALDEEDCHTVIERYLVRRLGGIGKKIHTARSRNDQVLTALRLYYKEELRGAIRLGDDFSRAIQGFRRMFGRVAMPGYTHMRKAMPSSVGRWAGAFLESMRDNRSLLSHVLKLIDQSPLGTGAGYGLPIRVDRAHTARSLGFGRIQRNPIYVQMSRGKFESSILHALNQVMFDLNKMATDILLFSMPEFGYFEIPEEFCTGSSLMPHKRNPDVLELVRAKYNETLAAEFRVKNIIGNLPSGYNRDLQLIKEPVMVGFDTLRECLVVMTLLLRSLTVNRERCAEGMTEELYSVRKAHDLVQKGMPFRDAYRAIATGIRD